MKKGREWMTEDKGKGIAQKTRCIVIFLGEYKGKRNKRDRGSRYGAAKIWCRAKRSRAEIDKTGQ